MMKGGKGKRGKRGKKEGKGGKGNDLSQNARLRWQIKKANLELPYGIIVVRLRLTPKERETARER